MPLPNAEDCERAAATTLLVANSDKHKLGDYSQAAALWTIAGRMAEANGLQSKRNGSLMRIADHLTSIEDKLQAIEMSVRPKP